MDCQIPSVVPFYPCLGEGSPTKIDFQKKNGHQLILTSLLEDLDYGCVFCCFALVSGLLLALVGSRLAKVLSLCWLIALGA